MASTICISLGGSGVISNSGINARNVKKFVKELSRQKAKKFVVVVGGGRMARLYINAAAKMIHDRNALDEIGIQVTRANASMIKGVAQSSFKVYPGIPTTLWELKSAHRSSRVVFMGGLRPGITTDAVTALACNAVHCELIINLSSQPYVYDRPPLLSGAKRLPCIDHRTLLALAQKYDKGKPGTHFIFDVTASRIVMKSKVEVRFVGYKMNDFAKAVEGKKYGGTIVKSG
ncbi:MAG: hypothetical protein KGH77_03975 [Candidatus Micrarchaeota archaeon]|nr:hypothetical protein [Candidatus Micrarchaeota archaeon]MDE1864558.1 hypothetical protein [Candidatus Micrarchaeota archaeon]